MSLEHDRMHFSDDDTETEENWYLFVDNSPIIFNSTYIDCYNTLSQLVSKYKYTNPERNFILDNRDEKFTLVSLPKNYPTSYERVEFIANIVNEQ